jgi:hypothetical protein
LIKALEEGRGSQSAAWALSQMGDGETVTELQRLLENGAATEKTKRDVIRAFGFAGRAEPLLKAAASSDPKVAEEALRSLGRIGGPEVETTLLDTAAARELPKKKIALAELAELGTPKAMQALTSSLRDTDQEVFKTAVSGLAHLGSKKAVEALTERFRSSGTEERRVIVNEMSYHPGPQTKGFLISALNDGDEDVVGSAARVLARIGGPEINPKLIALLQSSQNKTLRYRIASQLRWSDSKLYSENKKLIDAIYSGKSGDSVEDSAGDD